jgi:hypothetical protein
MVEQTQAGPPGTLSGTLPGSLGVRLPAPRRAAATPDATREPVITAPRLLVVMMVALLIPGNFAVAGAQLSPNRMLLLALFPYLAWHWLKGQAGKPNAVDVLMLLCTVWAGVALLVNHGLGSVTRAVMICVEIFGGYLFGRMMIRNTADYRRWFVLLTIGFALLLPFAVVELLTGKNLIRMIFDPIFNIPPRQGNLRPRLGLIRAQGSFEHPILFGLVGSMAFANVLYIYRDRFLRSVQLAAFFVFVVFTTISSGPMLSILIQAALTGWDRLLWFMRFKWVVFGFLVLMGFMLLRIASQFHVLDFIIQNLMFNPQTADGRLVILEYGSREIANHPLFGIGFNQWVRPWWKQTSVDNFWLNHAMRFGLPSALFFFAAIAVSVWRIVTEKTLSPRESSYRTGYLITLAGLVVVLGTVYIWSATAVFVCIYIGAGALFYAREAEAPSDRDRARRAAQARAFTGAGPYPAPPRDTPRPGPGRGTEARAAAGGRTLRNTAGGDAGRIPAARPPRARRGAPLATDTGRPSGDSRHV